MLSSSPLVSVLSLSLLLPLTLASPAVDPHIKREVYSCAVRGYDKGATAYGYSSGSSVSSLSACGTKCKNDSQCSMFAFGSSSCLLYKTTVSANVSPVSNSPYTFYDKACIASTSSSTSPLTTSTKPDSSQRPPSFAQTSSAKTYSAVAQPSSSSTCGTSGYDKGKPSAFYYVKSPSASTLEGCTAQCKTRGCVSLAVGNGECMLYSVPVTGNLNAATSSKYKFYDSTCVIAASSSISSVAKTTSSLFSSISGSRSSSLVSSSSVARTSSLISIPSNGVISSNSGSQVPSSSISLSSILPSSISSGIVSSSALSAVLSASASGSASSNAPTLSSAIPLSGSQISFFSGTIASSIGPIVSASISSSALSSSVTAFSASSSALSSAISSSVTVSVSSTASSRVVLPTINPSVDRYSSENLNPANSVTLFYTEPLPGTYTVLITATLTSPDYHGILLENINAINAVSCSPGRVVITFNGASSRATALTWGTGTVLFTLNTACNPANERGVFIITGVDSFADVDTSTLVFNVTPSKLQDVVQELNISYGTLETAQDGKQSTSYTTTATSYFMHSRSSTLTSSTFVTTFMPSLTSMTYTSAFSTSSAAVSSLASVSQSSFSASSTSVSSTLTNSTETLSPSALAIMHELSAGLPAPDANGNIVIPIKVKVQPSATISPEPYNTDVTYQAQLQAALAADKLDSPQTLLDTAVNALNEEAESNIIDGMGVTLGISDYTGIDDATYQAAINTPVSVTVTNTKRDNIPARAAHAAAPMHHYAPRALPVSSGKTLETRRNSGLSKRDGWDTFFAVMGDDMVGEICEVCGAISAGKDLYDAMKCLFGGCPSPPQQTITYLTGTTSQEFSMSATLNTNAYVYGDSKATVLCANCYIKVSSLKIEGKVQVVPRQIGVDGNIVLSAVFTATQSSVSSLLYSVRVTGANSGSFDKALSTFALDSVTAPGVVTISPKFLYGIGMTYETDGAVDVQAGAVMTLTNAAATMDIKDQTASNPQNWQPASQVTYPNLVAPGRIAMTPYMKTSIQISLNIFGQYLENAAVLTTQTNMGFDAQVLTTSTTVKARGETDISERSSSDVIIEHSRRSLFSSLFKRLASANGNVINPVTQQTAANTCDAGSMKLNAVMHTKNQAVVGGVANVLFDQDYRFGSKCIPFAAPVVTSSTTTTSPVASPTAFPVAVSASKPTTVTSAAPPSCTTGFVPPSGSKCFKVVAHGDPSVEGKYLSKSGGGSPYLDGSPAGTFYLDSNGYMYESYYGAVLATDRSDGGAWMNFEMTPTTMPKAQCTMDPGSSKALICYQTGTSVVSVCSSLPDTRRSIPMFGAPYECYKPITFTYEDTTCPFSCGSVSSSVISSPTVSSTPIASASPTALPCRDSYGGWIPPSGSQCFRVVGHGVSAVEGKYLSSQGNGSPTFQWQGASPGTYYLDANGYFYDGTFGSVMATDRTDGGAWMSFTNQPGTMLKAVCTKNSASKSLVCYQTSTNILSICGGFSSDDSRQVIPMFGKPEGTCQPITMTYEDIACPAFCSASSSTVTSPTSTMRSAVASSSSAAPSCTPLSFVPPTGSTCFTISGNGVSHIQNQLLSVHDGWANPAFGYSGYTPAIFYIDASGYTYIASDILNGYIMASNLVAPSWLAFANPTYVNSRSDYIKATCSLNPHSNTMGCGQNGTYILSVESTYSATDSRSAIPAWSVWDSNFKQISLTYNTVKCPVPCSSGSAASSPVQSSYPSSMAVSSAYKSTLTAVTLSPTPAIPSSAPTPISAGAAIPTPPTTLSSTSSAPASSATAVTSCGGYYPGGILPVSNTSYNIYCGQSGAAPVTAIGSSTVATFKACMDACTAISNCQGVIFREVDNYCTTYSNLHGPVTYLGSEIYDIAWIQELRHS